MSNADQLTEIDALESIFGGTFTTLCDKNVVKSILQPVMLEDADNINHIKADAYVIFGKNYPTNPLYSIFIDAIGMDEFKTKRFQIYIQQQLDQFSGAANGTKFMVMSTTKMGELELKFKNEFFEEANTLTKTPLINTSPHKSPGDIYLFELFEAVREWLVQNNSREVKSLRDMVENIDEIDAAERLRALQLLEEPEEEQKQYVDPYDTIDNVFEMEYQSDIPIEVGQPCTTEVFEKWSVLFLEQQRIHRLKILTEQGKIDTSTALSGKQLFLSNMVQELIEDDDQGASSFTYVRPVEVPTPESDDLVLADEADDLEDVDLDFDIDESLFDMSSDSDDDDYVPTTQKTTTTPSPALDSTSATTSKSTSLTPGKLEEKKSSGGSKKDKKDEKSDKKDKKSSSSSIKAKKDTKKGAANGFGDLGGGFSDFLGDF